MSDYKYEPFEMSITELVEAIKREHHLSQVCVNPDNKEHHAQTELNLQAHLQARLVGAGINITAHPTLGD